MTFSPDFISEKATFWSFILVPSSSRYITYFIFSIWLIVASDNSIKKLFLTWKMYRLVLNCVTGLIMLYIYIFLNTFEYESSNFIILSILYVSEIMILSKVINELEYISIKISEPLFRLRVNPWNWRDWLSRICMSVESTKILSEKVTLSHIDPSSLASVIYIGNSMLLLLKSTSLN